MRQVFAELSIHHSTDKETRVTNSSRTITLHRILDLAKYYDCSSIRAYQLRASRTWQTTTAQSTRARFSPQWQQVASTGMTITCHITNKQDAGRLETEQRLSSTQVHATDCTLQQQPLTYLMNRVATVSFILEKLQDFHVIRITATWLPAPICTEVKMWLIWKVYLCIWTKAVWFMTRMFLEQKIVQHHRKNW
jgi:hypothetical protein